MTRFNWNPMLSLGRSLFSKGGRAAKPARKARFRPEVSALEDRITPAPALLASFDGITFDEDQLNGGPTGAYHIPASPTGAASFTHLVSAVNSSIEVHDSTGAEVFSQSLAQFFQPLSPNPNSTISSPKIIYDTISDRFLVMALERRDLGANNGNNISNVLLAVSITNDPSTPGPLGWYYKVFAAKESTIVAPINDHYFDSPGIGVDANVVYITGNLLRFGPTPTYFNSGASGSGARLYMINKVGFYDGTGTSIARRSDPYLGAGLTGATALNALQPAQIIGAGPGGTVGTFLVSSGFTGTGGADLLSIIRIDNPIPDPVAMPPTVTTYTRTTVNLGDIHTGAALPGAAQAGTSSLLFTGDSRISQAVFRNNRLYAVNTVVPPSGPDALQATVHWYNISAPATTPTLLDQGNVGGEELGAGTPTFFPGLAVNSAGDLGITFSASNSNLFVGSFYTGRLAAAAAGTTQPTGVLAMGQDFYIRTLGGGVNRWGNQAGIAVDPGGANFWVYNQHAMTRGTILVGEEGRWATRWGRFNFTGAANTAPTLTLGTASVSFTENGTALLLDPLATVVDTDSADLDKGTLLVSFAQNGTIDDRLGINITGIGPGQINVNGIQQVFFENVWFATVSGGNNGLPLVFDLNSLATPAAVQALMRSITFLNVSENPSALVRTVRFQMTDGDGAISNFVTMTVNVTPVNDPPVNTLPAGFSMPQGSSRSITGISVADIDIASNVLTMTLSVLHGKLTVSTSVAGGVVALDVTNNSTGNVVITATIAKINATLASINGLRYEPVATYNGADTLTVVSNDNGFTGTPGALMDSDNLSIAVVPNHAPSLDLSFNPTLVPVPEDTVTNGTAVIALIAPAVSDVDVGALKGIAVTGLTGAANGTWEFALSGGAWQPIGSVSPNLAPPGSPGSLLLGANDRIRFLPNLNFIGVVTISYRAWDQVVGSAGNKVATDPNNGGDTSFSIEIETATLTVTPINDAPTLNPALSPPLTAIARNNFTSAGNTVATLLGGVGDPDAGALGGIAVIGTAGSGKWQYNIIGVTGWVDFGNSIGLEQARLLRPDNLVRFVPEPNFMGPVSLLFHAWDQTTGAANDVVNLTLGQATGGTTAFSSGSETATLTVAKPLQTIKEDNRRSAGNRVSAILGPVLKAQGPVKGIAVIGLTGVASGTWQFSKNGGATWRPIGAASDTLARLLRSSDMVRFVPNANFAGTASISYRSWDRTVGKAGGVFDYNSNTAAFSALTDASIVTVRPVNDRPVLNVAQFTPTLPAVQDTNGNPSGSLVSALLPPATLLLPAAIVDPDGPAQGIAVTGRFSPGAGVWQYDLNDGQGWRAMPAVSGKKALLLRDTDLIRFVPSPAFTGVATIMYRAWDQSTAFAGIRVSSTGGAFSKAVESATLQVTL